MEHEKPLSESEIKESFPMDFVWLKHFHSTFGFRPYFRARPQILWTRSYFSRARVFGKRALVF
jgi:hypothetical protein